MDFSYNNKLIATSGPLKPTGVDIPLDGRTRVETYADIEKIPAPYISMKIIVMQDETNGNKMTEYIVKTLKANSLGQPSRVIDKVQKYADFLGTGTGTSSSAINEYTQDLAISDFIEDTANEIYKVTISNHGLSNILVATLVDSNKRELNTDVIIDGINITFEVVTPMGCTAVIKGVE